MLRLAVLASGGGTNLQALLDHFNAGESSLARVALVMSDRPDAGALGRARDMGVQTAVIHVKGRAAGDVAVDMLSTLSDAGIELIALAGYLKLVPEVVIRQYSGRIINIHPALLPAFGGKGMYGMHVHRAVIESGCCVTGVTVHHVDERYDEGRTIAQWPVPVLRGDSPEILAGRVLRVEHALYPAAVEVLAARLHESRTSGHGFKAQDPSAFGWTDGEGIMQLMRRLLMESGETT